MLSRGTRGGAWPVAAGVVLGVAGCRPDPSHWPVGRPKLDDLQFLGQVPQAPTALSFEMKFSDSDGDSGAGRLRIYIGDAEQAPLSMLDLFAEQVPPILSDATTGVFDFDLALEVSVGEQFKISFMLEDSEGNESNRPSVSFRPVLP